MDGEIGWVVFNVAPRRNCLVRFALLVRPFNRRLTIVFLEVIFLTSSLSCQSAAQMPRTHSISGPAREVKKLHFPQHWIEENNRPLSFIQQLEVRKLPNSSDGEFFFAALPHGDWDYVHESNPDIPKPKYSQNSFGVSFTSEPRVRVPTEQEWESASRIVTKSRYAFSTGGDEGEIEYRGRKFQKAGKYSSGGLLSPGGKWLAIFSYTGEKKRDLFMDGGSVHNGDIFWQIYDAVTGEKVFEWQARNVKGPAELTGPVVWLEERYFLLPQDIYAQNFLVVTLPESIPDKHVP